MTVGVRMGRSYIIAEVEFQSLLQRISLQNIGVKEWKGTEQVILTYANGKKRLITAYKIFNEYKYRYMNK